MRVTIVLPFKNAEYTLSEAILSLRAQTLRECEILLVDNGSSDRSREIAFQHSAADGRVQLLSEPVPGVVTASNMGMRQAQGEFIARMDADDVAVPERLEKQVAFLEQNPSIDVVGSHVRHWSQIEDSRGIAHYVRWSNTLNSPRSIYLNRFVELPVINPTLMFRREILQKVDLYREGHFPEDYEMVLRWMEAGIRFGKVEAPLLQWRDTATRLTRTHDKYSVEAFYHIKARYAARWLLKKNIGEVLIWGAGKKAKQRAKLLEHFQIKIKGYIDVDKRKLGATDIFFENLSAPVNTPFILSYVGNRGVRSQIRNFLVQKGYAEGKGFLMMA